MHTIKEVTECIARDRNRALHLFATRTGELVRALREATADIREVEFSPDGSQIATAGDEQVARVWDLASGRQLFVLGGFTDDLTSLDYSCGGRLLAIAGYDGSLRFLFDPDGAALQSEGFDGVLRNLGLPAHR